MPLVSQVHVVSVHVPDHAAFNRVFLFLRDVLELPLVYGTPSRGENSRERLYAGFSVGNAYLEPCGPFGSDAPFAPDLPARFHGLTFATAGTIEDAAQELSLRELAHSQVIGGTSPRFIYLSDPLLTGQLAAVSLWEIPDKADRVNLNFLSASLQAAGGGALGLKQLQEIRIGYPGKNHLKQWSHFLAPARRKGKAWVIGNGPRLRFIPDEVVRIQSIVVQVESISKARAVLKQKGVTAKLSQGALELDPAMTTGLRIILIQ